MEPIRLKANYGYWRTNHYPIGGDFRRASVHGEIITRIIRDIDPPYKNCDIEVELADKTTAAINSQNTTATCIDCLSKLRANV